MDLNFNMIIPDSNKRFVEWKGKRIYIKDGNVTSIRKMKSNSL